MKSSASRSLSATKRPAGARRKDIALANLASHFARARADEVLALNWIDRWVRLTPATLVDACDQAGIGLKLEAAEALSPAERTEAMRYADACVIAEGPRPRFLPPRLHSIEGGAARAKADIDRYPFALDAPGEDTAFYATRDGAIEDGELRLSNGGMVFDRRTGEVVWEAEAAADAGSDADPPRDTPPSIGFQIMRIGARPILMATAKDAIECAERDARCVLVQALPSGEIEWSRWGGAVVLLDNSTSMHFWDRRTAFDHAKHDPKASKIIETATGDVLWSRYGGTLAYSGAELFDAYTSEWKERGTSARNPSWDEHSTTWNATATRLAAAGYHHGNPPSGEALYRAFYPDTTSDSSWRDGTMPEERAVWSGIATRLGATSSASSLTVEALAHALNEADKRWTDSEDCAGTDEEYWAWIAKEALKVLGARGNHDDRSRPGDSAAARPITGRQVFDAYWAATNHPPAMRWSDVGDKSFWDRQADLLNAGHCTEFARDVGLKDPLPPWRDFTDLDGEDMGSAMLLGLAGPPDVNGVTPLEAIARGCAEEAEAHADAFARVDAATPLVPLLLQHSRRLHGLAAMLRKVG